MSQASIVADYNQLAESFPADIPSNYEGTRGKPVSFAGTTAELAPIRIAPKIVKVSLRSIRAPRFEVSYDVKTTDTVFSLKERLVSDPNSPLPEGAALGSIKVLIKAKALSDVRVIADLPSTDFTVMLSNSAATDSFVPTQVYWPTKSAAKANTGAPAVDSSSTTKSTLESAPVSVSGSASSSEPSSVPESALFTDLKKVLIAHGREDLVDKVRAIV